MEYTDYDYYNEDYTMKTNIISCARCGENHENLEISKLTNPIEIDGVNGHKINYWAVCPKLNEPIIIMVIEEV